MRRAEASLAEAGVSTPRVDAELIVGQATRLSRAELAAARERSVAEGERAHVEAMVARRAAREPLQYVLGEWGFRRLTLTVDRRALVPRPETEVVVERCLALLAGRDRPRVLDVGTGSGAIALAVADEHPGARVVGIDAAEAALALARENVERTGLPVELQRHDLFTGLPAGPWDLVVSNPPYVEPDDLDELAPEVRDWEPHAALVGHGATDAIAHGALEVLAPEGAIVLEVAEGTAARVAALLGELGYRDVRPTPDLAGRDRVVEGILPAGRPVAGSSHDVEVAVEALRAGGVVVLPTDTVYGLAALPESEQAVRELYALKGRAKAQPTALVASSVDALLQRVPELREWEATLRAVLPGAYTLVLPNPAGRYPWLCAPGAPSIGVRVPAVTGTGAELLAAVGAVAATSANLPGGRDPRRLADVPPELLAGAGAVVDGGELPGTASTVVDLTGAVPRVLREGAVPAAEALERLSAAM